MRVYLQALATAVVGLVFFGLVLFVPAGTFSYWQAWAFMAVFTFVTAVPTWYLAVRDPAVLQRRLTAGPAAETRTVQRWTMSAAGLLVVAVPVVSALDHRFGWSAVPTPVVVLGLVLVGAGLALTQVVIIQNRFAAATVTVEDHQPVVSSGLYGIVRHPMYTGAVVMMVGMPLALDSYWGLVTLVPGAAILAARILDEEALLRDELDGYREYCEKVHYRLVPGVW